MKKLLKNSIIFLLLLSLTLMLFSCKKQTPDEALMVYKNVYTTQALYSYWLSTYKYNFIAQYNNGVNDDSFWDNKIGDGIAYEDYVTDFVIKDVKNRTVALWLFDQYKLGLEESILAEIQNDIEEKIEYAGSREAINTELAEMNMNLDMLEEVYIQNAKYDKVYEYLYSDNGIEIPDNQEKAEYFGENYHCLKLITIYSEYSLEKDETGKILYDTDGNIKLKELTEEEKKEKHSLISVIENELAAGVDFDECAKKFSEVDYSEIGNEIYVSENDYTNYGSDIIKAALELKTNEYRVIADSTITYIVMKSDLPEYNELSEEKLSMLGNFEKNLITEKKNSFFEALVSDVQVNTDVLDKYSIREVPRNSYY